MYAALYSNISSSRPGWMGLRESCPSGRWQVGAIWMCFKVPANPDYLMILLSCTHLYRVLRVLPYNDKTRKKIKRKALVLFELFFFLKYCISIKSQKNRKLRSCTVPVLQLCYQKPPMTVLL